MIRHHDTVWSLNMSDPTLIGSFTNSGIEHLTAEESPWGCACLHSTASGVTQYAWYTTPSVCIPAQAANGHMVYVRYTAKATGFTGTLRCNIGYSSVSAGSGTASGRYDAATSGTYDWTEFIQSIELPHDAVISYIVIGTAPGSGEAWIRDARFTAMHSSGYPVPAIDESWEPVQQNIRGFNIGNILPYTPTDYDRLQSRYKCNLIRVMIAPDYGTNFDLTTEQGYADMFAASMADMATHIALARSHGMKILVDCHYPPGGRAAPGVGFPTEYSSEWYTQFINNWKYMATLFKDEPAVWAFEIFNEPVYLWQTAHQQSPIDMNWWKMGRDAVSAIREIDPNRICVVEPDGYAAVRHLDHLEPWPFDNLVYSVHFYQPIPYNSDANTTGAYVYPGCIGDTPGSVANKEYLRQLLQPARDFQRRYKVPMFVGEFACMRFAPGAELYIKDLIDLFEEYRWLWAYFVYSDWASVNLELLPQLDPWVRVDEIMPRAQVVIDAMGTNRTWTDL